MCELFCVGGSAKAKAQSQPPVSNKHATDQCRSSVKTTSSDKRAAGNVRRKLATSKKPATVVRKKASLWVFRENSLKAEVRKCRSRWQLNQRTEKCRQTKSYLYKSAAAKTAKFLKAATCNSATESVGSSAECTTNIEDFGITDASIDGLLSIRVSWKLSWRARDCFQTKSDPCQPPAQSVEPVAEPIASSVSTEPVSDLMESESNTVTDIDDVASSTTQDESVVSPVMLAASVSNVLTHDENIDSHMMSNDGCITEPGVTEEHTIPNTETVAEDTSSTVVEEDSVFEPVVSAVCDSNSSMAVAEDVDVNATEDELSFLSEPVAEAVLSSSLALVADATVAEAENLNLSEEIVLSLQEPCVQTTPSSLSIAAAAAVMVTSSSAGESSAIVTSSKSSPLLLSLLKSACNSAVTCSSTDTISELSSSSLLSFLKSAGDSESSAGINSLTATSSATLIESASENFVGINNTTLLVPSSSLPVRSASELECTKASISCSRDAVSSIVLSLSENSTRITNSTLLPASSSTCVKFSGDIPAEVRKVCVDHSTGETVLHKAARLGYLVKFCCNSISFSLGIVCL